jgi:hypothetical protein
MPAVFPWIEKVSSSCTCDQRKVLQVALALPHHI